MTMKDKLLKLLATKKAERDNWNKQMIDADAREARSAIGDKLKDITAEIAELEAMIAELDATVEDAPAEESASREEDKKEECEEGDDDKKEEASSRSVPSIILGTMSERRSAPNGFEARANGFAKSNRMSIPASEARSVLLSTGSIAKPTSVNGIGDPFNTISSIVDMVNVEDMTGMGSHKEAFVSAWQSAAALTDGTAPNGVDPTFKTCIINPFLMGCVSYVSRELKKQTPLQYAAKVQEGALIAMKKKLANWIVTGGGSTEIYGIVNAVNTEASNNAMYTTFDTNAAIGADTLRKIVFSYGGDENVGANACLILNKADLIAFGDVRGTQEKKAIYDIEPDGTNPNRGVIKDGGLTVPYVICSDVTSYSGATASATGVKTMIYGDPKNYKLGLFGNYEVNVSEDYKFAEGLLTVRGEVMVGGNVTVENGFVVVRKKTA